GYTGHYCSVPTRVDPGVVACSFVDSGMRLFDIRDPYHPKEIAYANFPVTSPAPFGTLAFDAPAFVPERGEVWFTEGYSGFYVMKVTNGVWPFGQQTAVLAQKAARPSAVRPAPAPAAAPAPTAAPGRLAATGGTIPVGAAVVLLALGLGLRRLRRATA